MFTVLTYILEVKAFVLWIHVCFDVFLVAVKLAEFYALRYLLILVCERMFKVILVSHVFVHVSFVSAVSFSLSVVSSCFYYTTVDCDVIKLRGFSVNYFL